MAMPGGGRFHSRFEVERVSALADRAQRRVRQLRAQRKLLDWLDALPLEQLAASLPELIGGEAHERWLREVQSLQFAFGSVAIDCREPGAQFFILENYGDDVNFQ